MAIKGAESKQKITQELMNYFGDRAFLYNDGKEIRVNCSEDGELVQIKLVLTACKVAVESGTDNATPGEIKLAPSAPKAEQIVFGEPSAPKAVPAPTEEEKHNVAELMKLLGL